MIFRQIVFYALLVGVMSGLVLTLVQMWQVVPIIQSAEVFEGSSELVVALEPSGHHHNNTPHDHHAQVEWAPSDGIERTAYTLLANVLTAMGFALLMMAVMVASLKLGRNGGVTIGWRHALIWSGAGYVVFWLAPAIGLPPEIPLAVAAPVEQRQLWWIFAVVCTAASLFGLVYGKAPWRWLAPILLVAPHLLGAPHHEGAMFAGQPPATAAELELLAQSFIGATAIANAALWLVLGVTSVWAVRRISLSLNQENTGVFSLSH